MAAKKDGRNKRKPSCMRYTAARRWLTNKAKRVARHEKAMQRKRVKLAKRAARAAERAALLSG